MPIAKVQLPDGRVAKFEVPEGTTENQVMEFAESTLGGQEPVDASKPIEGGTGGKMMPSHVPGSAMDGIDANGRTDFAAMSPIGRMVTSFRSDTGGPSWGETAVDAVKNMPSSMVDLGKAMVSPIIHPVDTYKGLEGLVRGIYSKVTGGDKSDQQTLDALTGFYADKYGTAAKFKQYLSEEPAMVLADASMFLKTLGTASKLSTITDTTGKIKATSNALNATADAITPTNIVKQVVSPALKRVKDSVPESLYKSGAKFKTGKLFTVADRDRAVKTALDNGLLTKESTVFKIWDKINSNTVEVDKIIDGLAAEGKTIPRNKLYRGLVELRNKKHPQGIDRRRAINKLIWKLRKSLKQDIPVEEVQELKRNIYKELENHYKRSTPKPAIVNDFNETVARAAMLELENVYPELKGINKETADYLHLVKALEQSAKRIGNKNILSFDTVMKAILGHQIGDTGGMLTGFAVGLLDRDLVKQKIAVLLRKAKREGLKRGSSTKGNVIYGAGQTERAQESLQPAQEY